MWSCRDKVKVEIHFLASVQRQKTRSALETRILVPQEFQQRPDRRAFIIRSAKRDGDWRLMLLNSNLTLIAAPLPESCYTMFRETDSQTFAVMAVSDYQQPGPARSTGEVEVCLQCCSHFSLVIHSFTYFNIHSFNKHALTTVSGQAQFCSLRSNTDHTLVE